MSIPYALERLTVVLLGTILDFVTDPFAWIGAFSVARKSQWGARHSRVLHWVGWIGCGLAVVNSVAAIARHWPQL
jgi:hypothetical protein